MKQEFSNNNDIDKKLKIDPIQQYLRLIDTVQVAYIYCRHLIA